MIFWAKVAKGIGGVLPNQRIGFIEVDQELIKIRRLVTVHVVASPAVAGGTTVGLPPVFEGL